MGNRIPGTRNHHKPPSSSATAATNLTSKTRQLDRSVPSITTGKTRSTGVRLRNAVNSRLSSRSLRHQVVSCPDLGSSNTTTTNRSTQAVPDTNKADVLESGPPPAVVSLAAVGKKPTVTDAPHNHVGVTVYRSYNNTLAVAVPTISAASVLADDDHIVAGSPLSCLNVVDDKVTSDVIPDIKIYRRSAVLYADDEDEDNDDDLGGIHLNRSVMSE